MNYTEDQKKVIDIRDTNVLVSAAAGSGKTAVVVERVIRRVIKDRIDINSMLIVTFTRAAAEEMKGRIRDAFEDRLFSAKDDPNLSRHLEKQMSLIFDAPIMTIDSFCLDVIRNNFNVLDIDPAFRVADEGELQMLRSDIMEELMEGNYEEEEDSDFYRFLERFSVKKDDSDVTLAIERLHDIAVSHSDPKGFLQDRTACYEACEADSLKDNAIVKEVLRRTYDKLKVYKKALLRAKDIALMPEGPSSYEETIESDLELIDGLLSNKEYGDMASALSNVKFAKLSSKKNDGEDPGLRKKAKDIRDGVKKKIEYLKKGYFSKSEKDIIGEFAALKKDAEMLSKLAGRYMDMFNEAKKKRNIVDFSDIEHIALEILKNPDVSNRYKKAYIEIIIDEYQDSNRLQEEIFNRITNGRNYFCVGDVKQSIYSFRDACPDLFTDKFERYGKNEDGALLLLSKNFRSRISVLDAVNGVFKNIMHASTGSVEYDKDQYLNFGGIYKKDIKDDTAEYLTVIGEDEDGAEKDELEAMAVAKRIEELVGNYDIEDKKTNEIRKCGYGDIVILMRAPKGRDEKFMNVLIKKGIPVSVDSAGGYLLTDEIRSIINFLYVIDNPLQDIPLAGTCLSIFGGFDESELALIRAGLADRGKGLYFALKKAADGEMPVDPAIKQKASDFIDKLKRYRKLASFIPIHELLSVMIREHDYDNYVRALNEGRMRLENLNMLLYRASEFEKTSFRGLFRFIRYIEYIKKYDININPKTGGADNPLAVRIMSIHHSKGLEFPVVFLCGCHRSFNMKDISQRMLIDDELGAGLDLVDINKRVKRRTLAKSVMADRKTEALIGEELRVLYVAMTRAEQKLIMTGVAKKKPEENEMASVCTKLPADPSVAGSFGALLEYALETDESIGSAIKRSQISEKDLVFEEIEKKRDLRFERSDLLKKALSVEGELTEKLRKDLSRKYPHALKTSVPGKLSVSELKYEAMEEKGVDLVKEEEGNEDYEPQFILESPGKKGRPVSGAVRGTAYHTAFEKLDFEMASDSEGAGAFIKKMTDEGRITEDGARLINAEDITKFVQSPLGKRMKKAEEAGRLFREQPFVIMVKASEISDSYSEDENVMVQGVIDAYFEEDGRLVVVDYKTDRVKDGSELKERYETQISYYAKALTQLTGMEVLEKILYSVTLGECIVVQ